MLTYDCMSVLNTALMCTVSTITTCHFWTFFIKLLTCCLLKLENENENEISNNDLRE